MAQYKLGYIGKSFAMGALGVLGTIIAACGGGGTTAGAGATASPYVLYSSMYSLISGASSEPYAITAEGGNVYSFFTGNFGYQWGLGENANYIKQRQAYGVQGGTSVAASDSTSSFGLAIRSPANSSSGIDMSQSSSMVIQMGNGTATDAFANSPMVFTVVLNAGTQNSDYSWPTSCSYDQTLTTGSRPGTGQAGWGTPYGLQSYTIPLSSFTCTSGTLSAAKSGLKEVVVKVVGGKDSTASAVASNSALLQVGHIAFVK